VFVTIMERKAAMNLTARPLLSRVVAPLVVVAAVLAGGIALASRSDSASPPLAPRTAEQLLADVSQANVPGLSGTIVETARLGLPALPSFGGGSGSASLASLISGSHTVRVWYAGKDRLRLAVTGTLAESDLIRNGRDLWAYQSDGNTVTHVRLAAGQAAAKEQDGQVGAAALTPQEAARRVVAAITPTTSVQVERTARVADRDVYQLRLRPKDPRSLIDSVVLAVDGDTHVPLQVQIFAKSASAPAFETGFTAVQFRVPAADIFAFTPPPGAKVTERSQPGRLAHQERQDQARDRAALAAGRPAVLGSGWTAVLVLRNVDLNAAAGNGADNGAGNGAGNLLAGLLRAATPVQGAFGHGRVLRTALISGLLTDDGRLYAGAVTPEALQAAAAQPLSAAKPLSGHGATR
jgi:outer membrane lipoprotein-sorting protein